MKTASSFSIPKYTSFHCIGRASWPSETGATSRSHLTETQSVHKNFHQKQSLINHTIPLLTQPMNTTKYTICLLPFEFRQMYTFIQAYFKIWRTKKNKVSSGIILQIKWLYPRSWFASEFQGFRRNLIFGCLPQFSDSHLTLNFNLTRFAPRKRFFA